MFLLNNDNTKEIYKHISFFLVEVKVGSNHFETFIERKNDVRSQNSVRLLDILIKIILHKTSNSIEQK